MDLFEFNKIAGAVLVTALAVMVVSMISEIIYTPGEPARPGYVVAVVEASGEPDAADDATETSPIAVLLGTADMAAGEKSAKKCAACHTTAKGAPARLGPNLYGVVGRPVAGTEDFKYSPALVAKRDEGMTWTFENLDHFLSGPKAWLPGTAMSLALKKDDERANVIVFLNAQSDSPVPLPQETAATPQEPATEEAPIAEPPEHSTELPAPAAETPAD